jgi:hypothetical protein
MRSAWVEAERAAEVREAARDWKQAGAIDAETLAAIEAEFPVPHVELARAWKVLVFVLVSVAVLGVQVGVFGLDAKGSGSFFIYAAILAAATEVLRGSRLSGTGSDAATSFWAVLMLSVAFGILLEAGKSRTALTTTFALASLSWAAACWRWGFSLYGAFAAVAGFFAVAFLPFGRVAWGFVGAALSVLSAWLSRQRYLATPRRRAFAGVFVVSALALYGAINLYSFDRRIVEIFGNWTERRGTWGLPADARFASAVATAVVPIAFLAWGLRARRRLVLDTGAVLAALSVLTLEYYVRFRSLSIIAFGLALIGLALWLNRLLARAPGGEVGGFTASPILSAESEALAPAAALAAAAAAAPVSPHPSDDTDFSAGGGKYGGGGATGSFSSD